MKEDFSLPRETYPYSKSHDHRGASESFLLFYLVGILEVKCEKPQRSNGQKEGVREKARFFHPAYSSRTPHPFQ